MNASSVGSRSWCERMKILEVVIGSNHRFIQPQTVGKKAGAPIICLCQSKFCIQIKLSILDMEGRRKGRTHEYPIQRLRVMGRSQRRSILHMRPQIPKLLESYTTDVHDVIALRDGCAGVVSIHERRAQRHHEADQVLVECEET